MPAATPSAAPVPCTVTAGLSAVLTGGCEGYAAGTTGKVIDHREGCFVFAPDDPSGVARWAAPRPTVLVPPALVVIAG